MRSSRSRTPCCASDTNSTASTSLSASVATFCMYSPRRFFGVVMPGVSRNTIWLPSRVSTPRTRLRVVCARSDTMATFCPTKRLSSVLLPALGQPMSETKPER